MSADKKAKTTNYTMEIPVQFVEKTKDPDGNELFKLIVPDSKMPDFMDYILEDKLFEKFIETEDTKKYLAEKIGVPGLLVAFKKEDVLKALSWEYVVEFYKDHMNVEEVLNHIGWEKVKEHFADKISTIKEGKKDINTKKTKNLLGALDES